ncbi:MAG: protein translocase subunit SecDF [Bacteroidota bacterium]
MQGKGLVKFFLVVMGLLAIAQFMYLLPTNRIERQADDYAQRISSAVEDDIQQRDAFKSARSEFLDSVSNTTVFSIPLLRDYTYQDLKAAQLAYGLDLSGGMSVVLRVNLREYILALSDESEDEDFREALKLASQRLANAQDDYISLFATAWSEVRGDKTLANDIFSDNPSLRDKIGLNDTDDQVVTFLRERADATVNETFEMLRRRIDQLGVVQPNVNLDADRDLILVELPGIDNPARARQFLQAAAVLEFYDVYRMAEDGVNFYERLQQADQYLLAEQRRAKGDTTEVETEKVFRYDTTYVPDENNLATTEIARIDTVEVEEPAELGPLVSMIQIAGGAQFATLGYVSKSNRDDVLKLLQRDDVARFFPRTASFHFGREPLDADEERGIDPNTYSLYVLKQPVNGKIRITGDMITDARSEADQNGEMGVSLNMDQEGTREWSRWSTKAANDNNRQIAIVLDSQVISAPTVNNAITNGRTRIDGSFSVQDAEDLASFLRVGSLPARLEIIQEQVVGPSLGAENIRTSLVAMGIGVVLLLLFMVFYYGGAGIVSILALLLNLLFIFAAMASLGSVLTLPGFAGVILTIGMAVDANVIIFERVREELRAGKKIGQAVADGFANSYSAIIDANVTTLLVAGVLAYFGLGPIKGFAVVLIIGVLCSLFTAVLVGRMIIEWWLGRKKEVSFWTGSTKSAFANVNIDWMGKRKIGYAISGVLLAVSFISIFTRGFDLSVDFKGGYNYTVEFDQDVTADELRTALATPFGGEPTVKSVDADNTYSIVTDYLVEVTEKVDGEEPQVVVQRALHEGVVAATGRDDLSYENFSNTELLGTTHVLSANKVGPTIADDIRSSSWKAGLLALMLIFLYLLIRFDKWQYSAGAVAALFHDSIIVLGMFSLFYGILPFGMELDQPFIAAILTVIGYSINDTVVVFDRIREYINNYTSGNKTEVINAAINSTVSRTIITSLTTLFVVSTLFFFGGASIRGFAFALLIGILVGTYSSIFVATPIVHDLTDEMKAKEVSTTKATTDKKKSRKTAKA